MNNDLVVYGKTVTGGTPGTDPIDDFEGGSPTLHGVFSTRDDLNTTGGEDFRDDVIVGGSVVKFMDSRVRGSLHSHGSIAPDEGRISPDRIDGDVHAGDTVRFDAYGPDIDLYGDVYVDGDVHVRTDSVTFHDGDAEVHATGDVRVYGDTPLAADVYAGGEVVREESWNDPTVQGDAHAGTDVDDSLDVTGDVREGASATAPTGPTLRAPLTPSVDAPPPATSAIDDNRSSIAASNDNAGAPITAIETENDCAITDCELTAGRYHLDRMKITAGGTATDPALELDTSGGDVEIAVENEIVIKDRVEVTGPNQVRIYSDGDLTVESSDAAVTTPDDNASQLWVFVKPGNDVHFANGSPLFTGVIYGPGPSGADGASIDITNLAEIRGALIGTITGFNEQAEVHYDEEVGTWAPIGDGGSHGGGGGGGGGTGPDVVYLHVSETTLDVED